ncbi:uncharacterized protein K489DRAFT_377028 [Dissoconium aciculare CBS 342.82]|uniref:GPI anchored protein n=1 Tax=Dissoconium aciculare CBS 342.82 TaxID=1314786 RepID=A0A6J3MI66_9PEZI|nr:uncharacterized protein K489DRAFT_377028 [Dissoconium aciculare CBS 342.82]KAF1826597.1 hypothetical protein K489DRAFT_377028 [Dissoconium aciculare CBS 342.82]
MRPTSSTMLAASMLISVSAASISATEAPTLTSASFSSSTPQPFTNAFDPFLGDIAFLSPAQRAAENINNATESYSSAAAHDFLKKRQSGTNCPSSFNSCSSIGAANLCCISGTTCTADFAGRGACCPVGAVCTGTVLGVITAGTLNGNGVLVTATTTATGTASNNANGGLVTQNSPLPTTVYAPTQMTSAVQGAGGNGATSNGGFIVAGTNTVATFGAAARGAEIPMVASLIIRALQYLPL